MDFFYFCIFCLGFVYLFTFVPQPYQETIDIFYQLGENIDRYKLFKHEQEQIAYKLVNLLPKKVVSVVLSESLEKRELEGIKYNKFTTQICHEILTPVFLKS